MAIIITDSVTLDESSGLQNSGVPVGTEDNNDNDILVASLDATFSTRLFTDLGLSSTFSGTNGAATNTVATLSGGSTLEGFVQDDGSSLPVYVVGSGAPPTDIATSFTTLDGEAIYLCIDSASGLGDNLVFGVDASGDVVFAVYITTSGSDVNISMVQFEAIDNPDTNNPDDPVDLTGLIDVAITSPKVFNFDTLPSGQNLFGTVGDADAAIVVIGRDIDLKADNTFTNTSDTINTSQGGGTVTIGINNQMFDEGEGAYFTYVTDPDPNFLSGVVGGLDQNEADDLDNVQFGDTLDVTGGFLVISQIQCNTDATLTIEAFLAPNADGADFDTALGTGSVIDITSITVTVGGTVYTFNADGTQDGITVSNLDGVNDKVEIAGLGAGDKVEWTTATDHNQVLVEDVEGKFDIGQFGLTQGVVEHFDIGDKIRFEDDGPTATEETVSATVQEDDLKVADGDSSDGIDEDATPNQDEASGSVASLVTSGTDAPVTFSLSADTSGLQSLTSNGDAVTYSVVGDLLTATADDGGADERIVFTLTLAANGDYTFDLQDQLDHATASGDAGILAIDLSSVLVATDADGDTVTPDAEAFVINVENDVPVASEETVSATVQEDDLKVADGDSSDGIDEDATPNQDEASGSVASLVTSGADEPVTFSLSADTSSLQSLTSNGDAVTYSVVGDLLTATADDGGADERIVFTLTLAANGDYTFDLQDQLDHATASGDAGILAIDLSSVLVATDADGDTVTPDAEAFVINVENDVPVASGETVSATVQEDDLKLADGDSSDGIDEDATPNQDEASGSVASLVTSGADEPVTFSLSADTSGLQSLTSKGDAVTYEVNLTGDLLTATADDGGADERIVFTLALAATGGYTFDLQDQIDHAAASGDDALLALDLSSVLVATDADGDAVTPDVNAFVINVENDVPVISAQILSGVVDFAAGDFVSNSLNGIIGADENTADDLSGDGTKTYTFADYSTPTNVFSDLTAVLSADATKIEYYSDATLGTLVYDIVLDQDGSGEYTFTVHEDPPAAFTSFDFSDLPSGQNLFGVIAADKADLDGSALLVIGSDVHLKADGTYVTSGANASDTINTSKGGGPVTIGIGNQMFDPGDGAFFVYLDNPDDDSIAGVTGGLTQKTADDADTIGFQGTTEVTSASVEISQVQGNTLATMDIFAYDIDNVALGQVDTDAEARAFALDPIANADPVNITGVRVLDANGTVIESWTDTDPGDPVNLIDSATVGVIFNQYSVTVSGLGAHYTVEFDTEAPHDVADIEAVAGKFDIGGFNLLQGQDTPDQSFDFAVQITDYDSDVDGGTADAFANFSVGVDGTGIFDDGIA
ncbi:hypothetical protein NKJ06_07910 [Mesorhizobium sp. M0293]|uniref:T1SS-143 repeat domain-containing protein n=1 Tax=Mesorhizobium sp. M0293 TaxID=2956930 RepID=UPI003336C474